MLNHLRPAITLVLAQTVLLGIGYPLAVTGVVQAVMPATGMALSSNGTAPLSAPT